MCISHQLTLGLGGGAPVCDTVLLRGAETGYNGYKLYRTNCLPSDIMGLENTRNLSDVGSRSAQNTVQLSNGQTVLWLDSAVYTCPMVRRFCVHLSNGQSVLCPTVQWSDSVVYNCPMVRQCCVQLSNAHWGSHLIETPRNKVT